MGTTKAVRFAKNTVFGLVCVLVVAGCQNKKVLVQDKSPFASNIVRLGDTVVAEVDGTSIYLSDIEHTALARGLVQPGVVLTPANPVFQTVLDELIDQRLLAFEALRRSFDKNAETQKRLSAARERILSNVVVENMLAEKVTDEAVRRIYDEQTAMAEGGEQVRARHIVVDSEEKAKEIRELLETGGDFSTLAKEISQDVSTQDLGGDLGYFTQNALASEIADIAFETAKGEIAAIFETSKGWHILQTTDRRTLPTPKFEDIKPEITRYMTFDEIEKLLRNLRSHSDISLKLGGTQKADVPKPPK